MTVKRTYRSICPADIARIDQTRRRAGISQDDLARTAGLSVRTYRRMVAAGCGFPRRVKALRFALRTLLSARRSAERMFGGGDE